MRRVMHSHSQGTLGLEEITIVSDSHVYTCPSSSLSFLIIELILSNNSKIDVLCWRKKLLRTSKRNKILFL